MKEKHSLLQKCSSITESDNDSYRELKTKEKRMKEKNRNIKKEKKWFDHTDNYRKDSVRYLSELVLQRLSQLNASLAMTQSKKYEIF